MKSSLHFDKEINSNTRDMAAFVLECVFKPWLKLTPFTHFFKQSLEQFPTNLNEIPYSLHGFCTTVYAARERNVLTSIFYLFGKVAVSKENAKNRNIRLASQAPA